MNERILLPLSACIAVAIGCSASDGDGANGSVAEMQDRLRADVVTEDDLIFGGSQVPQIPTTSPQDGHSVSNGEHYNIWTANCHTATNGETARDPTHAGPIICLGVPLPPPANDDPSSYAQYHTFSYRYSLVSSGPPVRWRVTFYNWGKSIAVDLAKGETPSPKGPDMTEPRFVAAARAFCGSQYREGAEGTHALPPGTFVEIPGPSVCVSHVSKTKGGSFAPSLLSACLACCDARADVWPAPARDRWGGEVAREPFRSACNDNCKGFFSKTVGPR